MIPKARARIHIDYMNTAGIVSGTTPVNVDTSSLVYTDSTGTLSFNLLQGISGSNGEVHVTNTAAAFEGGSTSAIMVVTQNGSVSGTSVTVKFVSVLWSGFGLDPTPAVEKGFGGTSYGLDVNVLVMGDQ